jgi:hypothetical protein
MTPDEQRVAIARVFGWKNFNSASNEGAVQYGQPPNAPQFIGELPDYLNDLNAMHEAEQVLTGDQQHDYKCHLLRMDYPDWEIKVTHATAAQRAEAFLRTLGLWTETPTQPLHQTSGVTFTRSYQVYLPPQPTQPQ